MLSFGDLCTGVICMPDAECNPVTGWCRQMTYQEQLKKDPTGGTMEAGVRAQVLLALKRDPSWLSRAGSAQLEAKATEPAAVVPMRPAPTPAAGGGAGMALAALAGYLLFLR